MIGPGIYDDLCTLVRKKTKAAGVILMVIDGDKGSGFSAQFNCPEMIQAIPEVIRNMADQIEANPHQGQQN